jgi:hypothetical protein
MGIPGWLIGIGVNLSEDGAGDAELAPGCLAGIIGVGAGNVKLLIAFATWSTMFVVLTGLFLGGNFAGREISFFILQSPCYR